jgi:rhamnulokinase
LVGVEERAPIITREALERNFTNEGGVAGTIRFLKNVTGLWLIQQCRKAWERTRAYSYDELTRLAAAATPFQALIDPDAPEFLHPPDMPEAVRAYCRKTRQAPPASEASLVRSIFESLALKYRLVIDQMENVVGQPIERVHIIGGGSQNRLLCQFAANATGRPVSAGPAEATAVGNILVQAMALKSVGSHDDLRKIVRESFEPLDYEPRQDKAWHEAFNRFRTILAA